ncbi:MAG: hypothetical protein ACXWRG_17055 [Bdellovibrio sp.]
MNENVQVVKENKVKKEKDEIQITVTLDCESALSDQLDKVNEGFEFGRVTRKQLAVYLLEKGLREFNDDDVQAVRQSTLTDILILDHLYRQAKESGVVPDALKEILWKTMNLTGATKKPKKSIQSKYSNAILKNEEAA